ncbi:hypothetical protein DL98DRAFT_652831 [Cadophora sp. DSE1049]|nr:hypothetical protein DL98DRAFT_652831 [Cadophora sp. DSE1049]
MSDLEKDLRLLRNLYGHHISLNILCKRCKKYTCIGCRKEPSLEDQTVSTPAAQVNNCCDRGRLFGIWVLLARFDELEVKLCRNATKQKQAKPAQHRPGDGTGYNEDEPDDLVSTLINFGHQLPASDDDDDEMPDIPDLSSILRRTDMARVDKARAELKKQPGGLDTSDPLALEQRIRDAIAHEKPKTIADFENHNRANPVTIQILQILRAFLPSREPERDFDKHPLAELFAMLRLSFVLDRVSTLLRNDSIEDMRKRSELYHAVLKVVKRIARHKELVQLLTVQRVSTKRSPCLQALAASKSPETYFSTRPSSLGSSVAACARESYRHAKVFLDLASNTAIAGDKKSRHDKDSTSLCEELISFYRKLEHAAPESIQSSKPNRDLWLAYSEANRVTFSDAILGEHTLRDQSLQALESPRGRMAALRKEIASLTTSLPHGIFLKISESRPDVMKLLMIGVAGTPYEGGRFAFDVFLPQKWPEVPPVFYFAKYMGFADPATLPFCLSLLNTWTGDASERWQPHKSTLLSLFISVQAMILGSPNPLLNEPGLDADLKTSQLIKEKNDLVQTYTVAYAMMWWIRDEASYAETGVWKEISAMYWKCRGKELIKRVVRWARSNERLKEYCEGTTRNYAKAAKMPTPPGYIDMELLLKRHFG